MATSESEGLTPSQIMSSSQSSSEGGSIGSYVVVNKCNEHLPNSDSCQDGKSSEIPAKSENLSQAGSTAVPQNELMERVQNLTKENEELKGVLHQNSKLLEEYFKDLASVQKNQKQASESSRKGYEHAKEVVKKLREKNCTLKTELKNEQNKVQQLEEQLSKLKDTKQNELSPRHDNAALEDQDNPVQVKSLEEAIKRLESEKDTLELNNSKLQEHISCLKAMREAEQNTENDECETLISLESLTSDIQTSPEELQSENYRKLETEKEILKVDLEKLKIENKQKQQHCSQLEEERDALLKKLADVEQRQTIELEGIKLETTDTQASVAASEQVTALCQQLQVQTEVLSNLKEDFDAIRQENEMLKKKAEDLEKGKETTENKEGIETMKQQLQTYLEKERENQEAADKQAARQTELMKEIAELKQQLETERGDVGKLREDINTLTLERDACKRKVEELEMQPEESKGASDESFGESGDTPQKKDNLIAKQKKQLWSYQKREGDLLTRENAVLEKEKEYKQLLKGNKMLELQLTEALKEKDVLVQERREKEEEAQILQRQLSSRSDELIETHGHEVNQLKEELQRKDAAMETVINNGEQLKVNVTKLMERNENLLTECQMLKADCSQKEEEVDSLKKQLSDVSNELNETRERDVNQLKEELARNDEALGTAEMTMESLKVQVTQLIQENQSLAAEKERIMDDYTQQENMYQDHLHKITEDSESQRSKRDEIIKNLNKRLTTMDGELQRTRAQLEADSTVHRQLQEEHELTVTEYEQLLEAYHTMEDNKHCVRELEKHLEDSENHRRKLKEDLVLKDDELREMQQHLFDLNKQQQEENRIHEAQLEVYRSDFQVEREAREKQHEQILRLQTDNQRYQEEIDQLGNRGIAEMQRRHGSFVPEPRDIQQQQGEQPRGWFDGLFPAFARGPGEPSAFPNPEGTMGNYDRAQMGGGQREQVPRGYEEDRECPICRRLFPDFDTLQRHAGECNGMQAHPAADVENQCPSCQGTFPDYDTLAIHVDECLDQQQGN